MFNKSPLVSVITLTRNREKLLSNAIKSVLNQSYRNIEYIIINGASTDNTIKVVNSFNDDRIKLINLDHNYPIPQSINIGVEFSNGEFLTFLDDDDEYLEDKIIKQLNLILSLKSDYGFVYCWMDYYDKFSNKRIYEHHPALKGYVFEEVVENPIISGTPTYFFRKNSFVRIGGWKDDIGIISDWELAVRACQLYKVDFVPEVLVKVNVNHGQRRMSDKAYYSDFYKNNIKFHLYFLSEFKDVFNKYPKKKVTHLYIIVKYNFILNEWKIGYHYYKELLKLRLTIKSILLPFYCFLFNAFKK